jgi:two-component system, NarL family, nitrate/nitrite response regulator NarL
MSPAPGPATPGHDPTDGPPRVVVADDHGLLRQGMRLLLDTEFPGCEVVEAGTLDDAVMALRAAATDMLLLDLDMPGMSGIPSIRALHALFPVVKIAVVSGSADRKMVAECLTAGASGYVLKEETVEEVAYAIRAIFEGYLYVSPSLPQTGEDGEPMPVRPAMFTSRQLDVLRQLSLGRSNKEIARALGLSEGTVKIHLAAIFRLLGARNRTEAVVLAGRLKV